MLHSYGAQHPCALHGRKHCEDCIQDRLDFEESVETDELERLQNKQQPNTGRPRG